MQCSLVLSTVNTDTSNYNEIPLTNIFLFTINIASYDHLHVVFKNMFKDFKE